MSPFVTKSHSYSLPRREYQRSPYYDPLDVNEDNVPDNPGDILFWQETPTGQKDSHALNYGVSATFSIPLDGKLAARCKALGETQQKLMEQKLAHAKLVGLLAPHRRQGRHYLPPRQPSGANLRRCHGYPQTGQVLPHTRSPPQRRRRVSARSISLRNVVEKQRTEPYA